MYYNLIASAEESTVLAQYVREERAPYGSYQSEAALERALIRLLVEEGYAYLSIRDEADLIANLRTQISALNDYDFTDAEWERFFKTSIAPASDGIVEKTRRIQTDYIQNLRRDDGTTKNIRLIDKENIHNNRLQVINQYAVEGGRDAGENAATHTNRYDVTILVNGLPLVHLELKRRGDTAGVQSDQPLSAGQLLGGRGALRVRPDFCDLERDEYEILFQYDAREPHP